MGKLADHRTVATFGQEGFERMIMPGLPDEDVWWKNVSYDEATGQGSYLMTMAPGTRCNPHRHNGPEEFYVIEVYLPGLIYCLLQECLCCIYLYRLAAQQYQVTRGRQSGCLPLL